MTSFSEMEWSAKWDWENYVAFGSKAVESPKKLQFAESMVLDDAGSFNLSGGNSVNFPSAKSSISDSSNGNNQSHSFRFMTFQDTSGTFGNKMELSRSSTPSLEASVGFVEPLIGLKLGKRTYFENKSGFGPVTVIPTPSTAVTHKKLKSSIALSRCQVNGCNVDLSMAKDYHRKHRVCDIHSKSPKVVIEGVERRFCQQCSRFHGLAEFDDRKRSCRRRLLDHNARRRKPIQHEAIQFNSSNLLSRFSGTGRSEQQMSFQLKNAHFTDSSNYTWSNSKFTLTKSNGDDGFTGERLNMHGGYKLPDLINFRDPATNGLVATSKSSAPEVLNPGSKGSSSSSSLMIPSSLDAAPAYHRALSLLSNNSWASPIGPEPIQALHPLPENYITTQPMMMNALPEGVPFSYPNCWQHSTTHPRAQSSSANFQEIQLFKMPYEADFYANVLN